MVNLTTTWTNDFGIVLRHVSQESRERLTALRAHQIDLVAIHFVRSSTPAYRAGPASSRKSEIT